MEMEAGIFSSGRKADNSQSSLPAITPKIDAGALFVLKSKGSWLHCGYHLTTAIVAPPLLSLPFAFASLGWAGGVISLSLGAALSFYSYTLLSLVLDHHAYLGRRHLRFRHMAHDILGPGWGRYVVGPIQFAVCYGAVIGGVVLGSQSLKAIYVIILSLNGKEPTMKLYEFVAIFGALVLLLSQIPSFHSLRHINLVSLLLCLSYSACAAAGSIYAGSSDRAPVKDYSLAGSGASRIFGTISALGIIAATFGNAIIPEIQATVAPPVRGKMFKGLCLCYAVVTTTFFSVAISGYWAFGNSSKATVLLSLLNDGISPLVPRWFLLMTNAFTLVQVSAVVVEYLQPMNDAIEGLIADPKKNQYSARNVLPRLILRSAAVAVAVLIAAMLPFFGDIAGLIGAFGFLPLDFVIPLVFYNVTFRPSKRGFRFWFNTCIAVVFSVMSVVATVASIRQITVSAYNYRLFADV